MAQKWHIGYKSPYPLHKGQLFSNSSGSVRWTKQTLHPKKGGGGYVKPPMLSFSADPPPLDTGLLCPYTHIIEMGPVLASFI